MEQGPRATIVEQVKKATRNFQWANFRDGKTLFLDKRAFCFKYELVEFRILPKRVFESVSYLARMGLSKRGTV